MKPSKNSGPASPAEMDMLPPQPPAARWIAWLLMSLFLAIGLAAVLVHIPETVRCPFVLVPEKGADPIQAPLLALVYSVRAVEGQEVEAGAELFSLRSDEIRSWQTQIQTSQEDLRACQKRAAKLEEYYDDQLAIKDEELKQVEREVTFRQKHLATSRDFLARNQKLAADKLVSEVELLHHELEVAESEKDLNVSQRSIQQVTLQRRQLENERARHRAEEETEIEKFKVRIAALQRQTENCSGDLMVVRAPYRGVVISLPHRNPGGVVHPGEELCQVARVDGRPHARLAIREAGMPRLTAQQSVRLFFDAFPYQRYGTVTGKLEWISPATVASPEGQGFTARATLDSGSFTSLGHALPLRVGMKGEARILVGSRTALDYIFEPVRQLREQTRH
ncbi:MAG TPA: HlyD family efflux transporter periplasmic adaptor subunit [Methylomirabilota bacterium]|nr:HlyD family efflux transporter periplasmic adaptor subunit [Methylomirabilota bacterium]